jgi:DNA-binding transcriptional LysR family regulator
MSKIELTTLAAQAKRSQNNVHMKSFEPSLKQLRLLLAVSEHKGLVRAARRMKLSQSAASHALAALEKSMGVALVTRNRGTLQLTETGNRLLPHVRQICASIISIRTEISGVSGLQTGSLRLAAVPSLASAILPPLMGEFSSRFPGVEVSLFEGSDPEVVEWVRTRVADVGYATLPVPDVVCCQELSQDEWVALIPTTFSQHHAVALKFLSQQRFFMPCTGGEPHILELFRGARLNIEAPIRIREVSTIHAMVAQRLGVSILPSLAVQKGYRGLRVVPLSPRRPRRFGQLLARDAVHSPALNAWSTIVHNAFQAKHRPVKG